MQVTPIKLSKLILNPKIPNANQILISYFPHITILTFRRLMSYIYMEHPFLMFLDHTQRRSTVGRTPLDE